MGKRRDSNFHPIRWELSIAWVQYFCIWKLKSHREDQQGKETDGSNQWSDTWQGPGLIPCNLGASRRCCSEKAGVATHLLPTVEAPLEVTWYSRGWLKHPQPPLIFEGTYWIGTCGDSAPNLGSSINCLKRKQIQVSWTAAGKGEAGCCMRESNRAAEVEEENVIVSGAEQGLNQTVTRTSLSSAESWSLVGLH